MASTLMLPDGMAPVNLHLRPSSKVRYVDGDMFSICEQLAQISPTLYVVELEPETDKAVYVVMESCVDGVGRTVYKLKPGEALDGRVLERVRYLLHVPFEHRYAVIEAENARFEADHHENLLEEMYDKMGGQFRWQLEHDGFAQRNVSYPKANSPRARAGRPR